MASGLTPAKAMRPAQVASGESNPKKYRTTTLIAFVVVPAGLIALVTYWVLLPCPWGRQKYQGTCVDPRMVDFIVCLQTFRASKAIEATDRAVKAAPSAPAASIDIAIRERVEQEFSTLSAGELKLVSESCSSQARNAALEVPPVPPSPSSSVPPSFSSSVAGTLIWRDTLQPIANANVSLENVTKDGCKNRTAKTNQDGKFEISGCNEAFLLGSAVVRVEVPKEARGKDVPCWLSVDICSTPANSKICARADPIKVIDNNSFCYDAQRKFWSGTVYDGNLPLKDAIVRVKETSCRAETNQDGFFSLVSSDCQNVTNGQREVSIARLCKDKKDEQACSKGGGVLELKTDKEPTGFNVTCPSCDPPPPPPRCDRTQEGLIRNRVRSLKGVFPLSYTYPTAQYKLGTSKPEPLSLNSGGFDPPRCWF